MDGLQLKRGNELAQLAYDYKSELSFMVTCIDLFYDYFAENLAIFLNV